MVNYDAYHSLRAIQQGFEPWLASQSFISIWSNRQTHRIDMAPGLTTKEIVTFFYTKDPDDDHMWVCSCKQKRSQRGTGYTNLMDHIKRAHADYNETVTAAKRAKVNGTVFKRALVSDKAKMVHAWLEMVMGELQPFTFVEKRFIRKYVKVESICVETLCKYMVKLTERVERAIKRKLPGRFALVFDGWSCGSRYLVAVFASFSTRSERGHEQVLLSFSTFEDETTHAAVEHQNYMQYVLDCYDKDWDNVVALISDNVSVNKSLANNVNKPMIGCASHRYNLAIKDMIKKEESLFDLLQKLMVKLKYGVKAARLRKRTPLSAVLMNETRWSSAFKLLKRYVQIRGDIEALEDPELDALLPNTSQNRTIDALLERMVQLNEVQVDLQDEDCTMLTARDNFDACIVKYPEMENRLKPDARIVHSPNFERGIVAIQAGEEDRLTNAQKLAVECLRKDEPITAGESRTETLLESARKRRKLRETPSFNSYFDTRFLIPTSNICERFFSVAKRAVDPSREGLCTENFEAQMFLHCNMSLWTVLDVNSIM